MLKPRGSPLIICACVKGNLLRDQLTIGAESVSANSLWSMPWRRKGIKTQCLAHAVTKWKYECQRTSPGLRSSVALCSARSGGERDLTMACWDCCCCFSCCNLLYLFSASVSFCCSLSNCARCSSWMTSTFSFDTTIRNKVCHYASVTKMFIRLTIRIYWHVVKKIREIITELGRNTGLMYQ